MGLGHQGLHQVGMPGCLTTPSPKVQTEGCSIPRTDRHSQVCHSWPGPEFERTATIALHLPRRRRRSGLTAIRGRDDPRISQDLRSPNRLGPRRTLARDHAVKAKELLRLPRGIEPGAAMDTWLLPVPLEPASYCPISGGGGDDPLSVPSSLWRADRGCSASPLSWCRDAGGLPARRNADPCPGMDVLASSGGRIDLQGAAISARDTEGAAPAGGRRGIVRLR